MQGKARCTREKKVLTRLAVTLLVALGLGVSWPVVGSASHPKVRVKPPTVKAGNFVVVEGWVPSCDEITLISKAFKHGEGEHAGIQAISATVRQSDGYYKKRTRIPRLRRPDRYRISGRCGGGNVGGTSLRVLSAG